MLNPSLSDRQTINVLATNGWNSNSSQNGVIGSRLTTQQKQPQIGQNLRNNDF